MRNSESKTPTNFVPVGEIVGVFGIKGYIKVQPLTHFAERFDKGKYLYIDGEKKRITWCAWHKMQVRLGLQGIATPEQAIDLIGKKVCVPEGDRPQLDEDEYYAGDLIGMEVRLVDGEVLGNVDDVITGAAQDILRIGTIMIPMVRAFVKKIDLKSKRITVELLHGMRGEDVAE